MDPEEAAKQMDFFGVSESELMRDWDYVTFKENGDGCKPRGDCEGEKYPGIPNKSVISVQVYTLNAEALNHDGE